MHNMFYDENLRLDSIFFARELEKIDPRDFQYLYANLSGFRLIPTIPGISPGADTYTWQQYRQVGSAKVIANYADDLPTVELIGNEFKSSIKSIGSSYIISTQDLRAAREANKPLERWKLNAVVESIVQKHNQLLFTGDPAANLVGWLTSPNINKEAVSGNNALNKKWITKLEAGNGKAVLKDLTDAMLYVINTTKGVESPNRIVLDPGNYELLLNDYKDLGDMTIEQRFKMSYPDVIFERAAELKGAFEGGTDGFILYTYNEIKMGSVIPTLYEAHPMQYDNLAMKVPFEGRNGGVVVRYPDSQVFRYGI